MVWSIVVKQALKPVLKKGAKEVAKKGTKEVAKKGAKKVTKEVAKKFAEKTLLEKTITILDYTDPFYWMGRGIKSLGAKRAAKVATRKIAEKEIKKAARHRAFRQGATKVGILGALGAGFTHFASSIVSTEFLIPAAGAALGTWGMYKIKSAIDKKKEEKAKEAKEVDQPQKLTPKQIRMLQAMQQQRVA